MYSGPIFEEDDVTSHDLTIDVNPKQKQQQKREEKGKECTTGDIFRVTLSKGRISTRSQFSFSEGDGMTRQSLI